MQKQSALIDLIQLPKDVDKCSHLLFKATADSKIKGVITDGKRGIDQNDMFIDENPLSDILIHLKPTLTCSIESLRTLIVEIDLQVRQSPLSMVKHFKPCAHASPYRKECL